MITCLIILLIIIRNFSIFYLNKKNYHQYVDTVSPYRLLYIDNNLYLKNEKLKDFILEQNQLGNTVKILSYEAYLPIIELKINNGKYDLFFNGNLGFDTNNSLINEIKNSKKTFYLIKTDKENWFYQEPFDVKNYIIDNLNLVGTIFDYSIYYID